MLAVCVQDQTWTQAKCPPTTHTRPGDGRAEEYGEAVGAGKGNRGEAAGVQMGEAEWVGKAEGMEDLKGEGKRFRGKEL